MNLGEMRKETRRLLDEETDVFYSDDDINFALNEGLFEMADATEFYEREAMIPMLKWRTYYDLSLILPDTFLSPRRCFNVTTNKWLDPADTRELDYHTFVQWELTLGEPEKYLMRGNWWFGVFPRPTKDNIGIRFIYSAIPSAMEGDRDTPPDMLREFHPGLIEYALCDLMGQERETKKAVLHWKSYKEYEGRLASFVDGRTRLPEFTVK